MKKTTDIVFVAWLLGIKKVKFCDFEAAHEGHSVFSFDMEDSKWKKLKIEFLDSEANQLKYTLRQIKEMIR